MGSDRCIKACIHHCSITQSGFTVLKTQHELAGVGCSFHSGQFVSQRAQQLRFWLNCFPWGQNRLKRTQSYSQNGSCFFLLLETWGDFSQIFTVRTSLNPWRWNSQKWGGGGGFTPMTGPPGDLNLKVVHAELRVIDQLQCRFSYFPASPSTLTHRCFCSWASAPGKWGLSFCLAPVSSSFPWDPDFTDLGRVVDFSFCSAFYLSKWSGNFQVSYMPFWELEALYPLLTIFWDILLQILKLKFYISLFRFSPQNIVSLKLMWYLNKSLCQWFVKPSWDYSIEGVDEMTK